MLECTSLMCNNPLRSNIEHCCKQHSTGRHSICRVTITQIHKHKIELGGTHCIHSICRVTGWVGKLPHGTMNHSPLKEHTASTLFTLLYRKVCSLSSAVNIVGILCPRDLSVNFLCVLLMSGVYGSILSTGKI